MKKLFGSIFVLLGLTWFGSAHAALLYSQTANQAISLGQTFTVNWLIDTQGQPINSADLTLHFTPGTLEVESADPGSSGFNLWIKTPVFDNNSGTLNLTAGLAGGVDSSKLKVFQATFKAKATGNAQITLDNSSNVLLANGTGTPLQLSFAALNFPVIADNTSSLQVTSTTHPDETAWYKDNNVEINVTPVAGEQYSYQFTSNTDLIPDDKPDDVSGTLRFDNLPDGIYYFKLNSRIGNGNWTEALVRRFQIDSTPPQYFTPVVASDPSVFGGQAFVSFATTDQTSGIDHYEVKVGSVDTWHKTNSTNYVLPKLHIGDTIQVKAIDKAGNEQLAQTAYNQSNGGGNFPKWLLLAIIIVSVLLLLWLSRIYLRHLRKKS